MPPTFTHFSERVLRSVNGRQRVKFCRSHTDLLLQRQTADSLHARSHDYGGHRARAQHFVVEPVAHKAIAIPIVLEVEIGVVQGIPGLQEFA